MEPTPGLGNRWDATPGAALGGEPTPAANRWDATPGLGAGDATPAAGRWDDATPGAGKLGGPTPRRNRWDDATPARVGGRDRGLRAVGGGQVVAVWRLLGVTVYAWTFSRDTVDV